MAAAAIDATVDAARKDFFVIWNGINLFVDPNPTKTATLEAEFMAVVKKTFKAVNRLYRNDLLRGETVRADSQEILNEVLLIKDLFERHGIVLVNKKEREGVNNAYFYGGFEYWQKFFQSDTYTFFKDKKAKIQLAITHRGAGAAEFLAGVHELFTHYRADTMFKDFSDDLLLEIIFGNKDVETYMSDLRNYFDNLPKDKKKIIENTPLNFLNLYFEENTKGVERVFKEWETFIANRPEGADLLYDRQILAWMTRGKNAKQCEAEMSQIYSRVNRILSDKNRPHLSNERNKTNLIQAIYRFRDDFADEAVETTINTILKDSDWQTRIDSVVNCAILCNGNMDSTIRNLKIMFSGSKSAQESDKE